MRVSQQACCSQGDENRELRLKALELEDELQLQRKEVSKLRSVVADEQEATSRKRAKGVQANLSDTRLEQLVDHAVQSTITSAVKGFKTTISDLQERIEELLAENRMILENLHSEEAEVRNLREDVKELEKQVNAKDEEIAELEKAKTRKGERRHASRDDAENLRGEDLLVNLRGEASDSRDKGRISKEEKRRQKRYGRQTADDGHGATTSMDKKFEVSDELVPGSSSTSLASDESFNHVVNEDMTSPDMVLRRLN
ncbi:hypothetical protein FOZ63_003813 [Perkinsus olseni]|uniref:Uncharacterized protein n=1 Tax=Perkinsus olseni TaxID=32597 RepID=A0A7J6R418_PEROL|nr:hypothetical protein FOZ63_003813 [Perkinsus olseni]KAF4715414.1 hypothetical protein FOZ62_003417 [Perkinsus olseni]